MLSYAVLCRVVLFYAVVLLYALDGCRRSCAAPGADLALTTTTPSTESGFLGLA